jgi:hypothetical protein
MDAENGKSPKPLHLSPAGARLRARQYFSATNFICFNED